MLALRLISSPPTAALEVDAKLEVQPEGFLLTFEMTGKGVDTIIFKEPSAKPVRKNELWKETCFECFFAVGGLSQYFEFNGSTSGDWALYSFDDYRQGMKEVSLSSNPKLLRFEKAEGKTICQWHIPYFTKAILSNASITAVIKSGAEVSYWALKHAGDKPDFHLRESFIHRFI